MCHFGSNYQLRASSTSAGNQFLACLIEDSSGATLVICEVNFTCLLTLLGSGWIVRK